MANSKKNVWLTIVLAVLILVNVAALITIYVWHPQMDKKHDKMGCDKQHPREILKKELNLSEEQSLQFDGLRKEHKDSVSSLAGRMREKRNMITTEMMKTLPDSAVLFAACDEIGDLYASIRRLNILHYWKMKALCNEEQKKKLDTLFKDIFCCDEKMLGRFNKDHKGGCNPEGPHQGCQSE